MKTIRFFATRQEILQILRELEAKQPFYVVESGLFSSSQLEVMEGFETLVEASFQKRFLISESPDFIVQPVRQRRGGFLYAVDLGENRHATSFEICSEISKNALRPGVVGSHNLEPSGFLRHFQIALQSFIVCDPFLVSPGVRQVASNGGRLIPSGRIDSPIWADLVLQ